MGLLIAAFASIYLIWGSTYLAIRIAIETLPPFLMAATRFLVAGAILWAYVWWIARRVEPSRRPVIQPRHWRSTALVGGLLLLGGNGGVVWAEQHVSSGLTAVMVAAVPIWMTLIEWLRPGGSRPSKGIVSGLTIGFIGIVLLVSSRGAVSHGAVTPTGASVLVLACLAWSIGSILSKHIAMPESPLAATAMQMLCGGGLLLVPAAIAGDFRSLSLAEVSPRSLAALAYLIVFGSLVAFSAYVWLLKVAAPARVGTYAYVNPVVAVLLGWGLANEPVTPRTLTAAGTILSGVAIITTLRGRDTRVAEAPRDSGSET